MLVILTQRNAQTQMKKLFIAVICLASFSAFAQNIKTEFAGGIPYTLTVPQGWRVERLALTGKISTDGVEDMRLTQGWNNPKSGEYWTYASLWSLENTFKTDAESIKNALTTYYADLLIKNIKKNKIPARKILQVKTWIVELEKENGDSKTFYGAVAMLDYKTQVAISLNCVVHVRSYPGQNKTFVFYELSPKPLNDGIWKSLDQLWSDFDCVPNQPYGSN